MSSAAHAARPPPIARVAARRRRLAAWLLALNVACQVPLFLSLRTAVRPVTALVLCAVLYTALVLRFRALRPERRRSRLTTRLLDEPLFVVWGTTFFSLPLFVATTAASLLAGFASPGETPGLAYAATVSVAVGAVVSSWCVWGARRRIRVARIEVPIAGLDPTFDGYTIVHLSDLHVGNLDPKERGLEWASAANAQRADLCVVTGDLVTAGTSFYEDVADVVGALRATDGVLVSMGNHDQWDEAALVRALEKRSATVLKNGAVPLCRGSATVWVAGLDDWFTGRDDLDAALRACSGSHPIVLLSHYPHFFEAAADRGIALVLSGHTHGGQLGVPGLADRINLATVTGQRSRGLYRRGSSHLYVNAGLGTTGPPMRLGIPPEIARITLRASPSRAGAAAS